MISSNKYKEIYHLKNKEREIEVIEKIFNKKGRLRSFFKKDKNHSWYVAGAILYNLDDYVSSIYCFKKSLKYRKNDDDCMLAIGNCHDRLGRFYSAEKWFRRAMSNAKDQESLDVATYNLGNSLFDQKKYNKAIKCYKRVSYRNDETGEMARKNLKLFKKY